LRADWLSERLAVKAPLAEDLKSLSELSQKLEEQNNPPFPKEENMPCGPATRAFAGLNPVPAAQKPAADRPVLPLSAWYSGDAQADRPPFTLTAELVDMRGEALKVVKAGDQFRLRVTTDRDAHFVLLMVW